MHLRSPYTDLRWLLQVVDDSQADSKDDGPVEWISYWKPNVTINLVDDFTKYVSSQFQGSVRFCFY